MKKSFFLIICLGLFSGNLGLSQEVKINRKETLTLEKSYAWHVKKSLDIKYIKESN